MHRWSLVLAFALSLTSWSPLVSAQSSDSSICKTLYRQKKYTRAANCFFDLAKQWEVKKPPTGQSRAKAGGFLRNASLCYRKAAKLEKVPHKKAFLRERAMLFIERILNRKLYESPSQKRLASHIKGKLEEAIGYIQVTIVTGEATASGKITGGYRFSGKNWKGMTKVLKLRPGAYTAVVNFAGKASKVKVLKVKPKQAPMVVDMKRSVPKVRTPARIVKVRPRVIPKLPAPKSKLVPIVVISIGAALVVTGAVLTGVAFSTKGGADSKIAALKDQQQTNPGSVTIDDTEAVIEGYESANTMITAGLVIGGTGIVTVGIGIVLLAIN